PLLFARDYGASIAQRFYLGRLGRGWVDNLDVSLTNDASAGIVTIHHGSATRLFGKDDNGSYVGIPWDFGTLTHAGGALRLREKTGEVIAFRVDGSLDFIEDTNGNRLTAGYTGSRLSTLTHSGGQILTLAYNAQGRISQVSDQVGRVATYAYDASGEHLQSVT